ncbi:diguanylate cyclase [bacterium]|nr:diguanylate cyclase [bacterium]
MSASAFHAGRLSIDDLLSPVALSDLAVDLESPLLDAALQLARSPYQHLLVRSPDGQLAGVVSDADLLTFLARTGIDDLTSWKTRGVESAMPVRFRSPNDELSMTGDFPPRVATEAGCTIDCVPIIADGRLVGVQTTDDLLLSWSHMQTLIRSATTDELTTLTNRSTFQRRLTEEWDRSKLYNEPLALLLIDLDDFKAINDSQGHLAGDAVLAEFGVCLQRTLRLYDVVARFGGDEFVALCCNCDPSSVDAPIRRLLSAAHELPLPYRRGGFRISASIGAAIVTDGFDQLSTDALIAAADKSLYASKQAGRDCAHCVTLDGGTQTAPVLIGRGDETHGTACRQTQTVELAAPSSADK